MRIKVTGYIPVDDLDPEDVDLADKTGMSEAGFDRLHEELGSQLEDLDAELVED